MSTCFTTKMPSQVAKADNVATKLRCPMLLQRNALLKKPDLCKLLI